MRSFITRAVRRPAIICLLATALNAPVSHADEPLPPIRPATYDWQGPYAGILLGLREFRTSHADFGGTLKNFDASGRIAGIIAGYNFTHRQLVFGPEADISYGLLKATGNASGLKEDFYASLRARIGRRFGRTLPYLSAGISAAKFSYKNPQPGMQEGHLQFSATAGTGIEFAVASALSARLEYLYGHKIGQRDAGLDQSHIIRAAATYQFDH